MFLRWLGLTFSLLMCMYAGSFLIDGKDTSANEWMRQILTMFMALLLLFWSLTGIWSRPKTIKFTWWTYRMAIKRAFDCEHEAFLHHSTRRWSKAKERRTALEDRMKRERGRNKRVRSTS